MNLIGKIEAVCAIEGCGHAIITDQLMISFDPSHFPAKTELELRTSKGNAKRYRIKSAELALRCGKDYLAFILEETAGLDEIKTFHEVWGPYFSHPIAASNNRHTGARN